MKSPKKITLQIILEHVHEGQRVHKEDLGILHSDMKIFEASVAAEFRSVKNQINTLSVQVGNIDKRLDDIELEFLPRRVKKLERAVFAH